MLLDGGPEIDCRHACRARPQLTRLVIARMEKSIYRYILKHSLRQQIYLIALTAASMPLIYVSLEIPKRIINEAIGGENIPDDMFGYPIDQISYLMLLCGAFLALVIINGGFKFYLNLYRGVLGERMLRRLRYELYTRIMRFPLPHFKRTSPGEIIPMLTAETEPLGGFIGEAYALPAMQGGLLITYLFFIYNQDLLLGIAATALYPFQLYLIPKLQKRVNILAKKRVLAVRKLSDRIGETVSGVTEIHAHDTSRLQRADIGYRLGNIFTIRYDIYKRKFFIKFLNGFLAQVTPFFFYSVGGIFVIRGDLTIGALVAVLAAYKDLASPWAEILKYYQMKEDVRVKYTQIIEQFHPPHMLDLEQLDADPDPVPDLSGEVLGSNLSFAEDDVVKVIDGANFRFRTDQHVAAVGLAGSGKDELSRLVSRLLLPTGGRLSIAGQNLADMPEAVVGRRLAYVGPNTFMFAGTVRDNLFYGLKHRPVIAAEYDGSAATEHRKWLHQAEESGNSVDDPNALWLDLEAAGVTSMDELERRAIDLAPLVEMQEDIYQLGLRSTLDPGAQPELAERILQARRGLRELLESSGQTDLVEPFANNRYNTNASVAENLIFGTPKDRSFNLDDLANHPYVQRVLRETNLLDTLVEIGSKVAETMVDLFSDLPPGHEFFERFSFISSEDLPDFQVILGRIANQGLESLSEEDRARLLSLAFMLIPARHRLDLIDEKMQERLLQGRAAFAAELPAELADVVEFFDPDKYNAASTVRDNILFGRRVYGQAQAQRRLTEVLANAVEELDLRGDIIRVGLDYQVGTAGGRLAPVLRQKIGILRCLLKRPTLLVINEATSNLDATAETRVMGNLREHLRGRGLFWVLSRPDEAEPFEVILVMEDGKVAEQGSWEELRDRSDSVLQRLLSS